MGKKKVNNETVNSDEPIKKQKLFSAKEFRKQLSTDGLTSLKTFLQVIQQSEGHDYVFDYLESGGNCLELLHTLEVDSSIPPATVFELITLLLLKINTSYPQYQSSAYEACRYILNNYITVLNKMINLSSTTPERKSCLKLLTAMVTFSPVLAKDILIHVNFHSANVELLTKHTGEKGSTRDNFIKFLTAYLVDGHYPALSVLLEKKGFFTSIISGLKFDSAETLCLVISAMKNFILENPSVSKTAKMKTFNTVVVRDIVNLYNWKGPEGFRAEKKKNATVTVNEIEKSKVNESVHDFLLILCTNHKFGVIFKDPLVGLGKKNQNALMYTVLESLDRPWEHSYASELVTNICKACPDLAKTLWTNLKLFLEPRLSQKWVNTLKFAVNLIKELEPNCIEYCIKDLNDIQLFQIVQCIMLPLPILKTILPENNAYDSPAVKQYILTFLLEMLKTLQQYIKFSKRYLNSEKYNKFNLLLNKYISKHFPNAVVVLNNWEDSDMNSPFSNAEILEIIFDILNHYKNIAPDLLESLNNVDTELSDLLTKIDQLHETDKSLDILQVKIINVFVDLDQTNFTTHSKMFRFVMTSLLKIYYNNTDTITLSVLQKLFRSTGIFDGCFYEINIWINGVLNLKHFDKTLTEIIVDLLTITDENILQFLEQLSSIQTETGRGKYYNDIIENLMLQTDFSKDVTHQSIRHRYLSPMILGLLSYLSTNEISKPLKVYVNFVIMNLLHLSTQIDPIIHLISKCDALPFKEYAESWVDAKDVSSLNKFKGRFHIFEDFSEKFLAGEVDNFLNNNDLDLYADLKLNLLDNSIFYLTNLLNNDLLSINIIECFEKFVKNIIKRNETNDQFIERVLSHPVLLYNINFLEINKQNSRGYATKCLTNLTTFLLKEGYDIEFHLDVYRQKLLNSILKILNKPQKYQQLSLDLKTLLQMYGLGYHECINILQTLSETYHNYSQHDLILEIFGYSLTQFTNLCVTDPKLEPLDDGICAGLTTYLISLAKNQQNISLLSPVFLSYFKKFPHAVSQLDHNLFKVLLDLEEINKDNVKLATFLLEKNLSYVKYIRKKLEFICEKKGLLLPLLTVLCKHEVDNELISQIYQFCLTSLNKTLQKPQKVGQHFHENYQGLVVLINDGMSIEMCKQFFDKVQKFDVTEIFHAHLLKAICFKALNNSVTSKELNNMILTFIHLQVNLFKKALKSETEVSKAIEISKIFVELLKEIKIKVKDEDLKSTAKNETVKLYFKFCLKYGVSKQPIFLNTLRILLEVLSSFLEEEDGRLVLEMLTSHSEFLEIVLGEYCETKTDIFSLYLILCKLWPQFMERQFVPLLLASYRALVNKCDRIILLLLRMYESKPEQTHFYDFKPFLWGKAAATHYSVKQQLNNALWREPKTSDVLDILQDNFVRSTIKNYPLKEGLGSNIENEILSMNEVISYDLSFLLPLFSQLLAPEQHIQTYKFTRSGALSLTVVGLSSADEEIRKAAFHVLARLHYHVEARQTGKDNLLWIRYIEAVCQGIVLLPDYKLNNFAAIYLARMALILTQPNHVMYLPLSQHLAAKLSLDFSTVPELYTFLHSSDVNFKEHRIFTLELLRDGLRTEKDFADFMRSMAFKLFSELYSSVVSDYDTRLLILDVVKAVCEIPLGVKVICENYSFVTQLANAFDSILKENSKEKSKSIVVKKILEIIIKILKILPSRHLCSVVYSILKSLIFSDFYNSLVEESEETLFEILVLIQNTFPATFSTEFFNTLLNKVDDPICKYIDKYGCDVLNINDETTERQYVQLRLFVVNFKKQNAL